MISPLPAPCVSRAGRADLGRPLPDQGYRELGSGMDIQFLIDRVQMDFDGTLGNVQFLSNRPIRESTADQSRDLSAASC